MARRHVNIAKVQASLAAEVSLLREGTTMQRVARSAHARTAAGAQVRQSEAVVKEMSAMLEQARADAAEDANHALRVATEVRQVSDSLKDEASAELKALGVTASSTSGTRK